MRAQPQKTIEGLVAALNKGAKARGQRAISVEALRAWLDDVPVDYCTDPKSDRFFEGANFEEKASVLKHVSPEQYRALGILLDSALRDSFKEIGPKPSDVKNGGVS